MPSVTVSIGDLRLVRVLYTDASVAADRVSLDPATIAAIPWAVPRWSDGEHVAVGAAAWVIEHGSRRIVIDPFMAADDIFHDRDDHAAHAAAIAAAFDAAAIGPETIERVVFTHLEGIGLAAVRDGDGWRPFFPSARVSISATSIRGLRTGAPDADTAQAWAELLRLGIVDVVDTADESSSPLPGVTLRHTGGHDPGHFVVDLGAAPDATMLGHLALSPIHLACTPRPEQHADAGVVAAVLEPMRADGRLLIGPLWPTPALGRWTDAGFVELAI